MHRLPDNLRDLLKTPMGKLVLENELIEILKDKKIIVSVGDQVTYTILKYSIEPIFCIVDYQTRRGKFPSKFIVTLPCVNSLYVPPDSSYKTSTLKVYSPSTASFGVAILNEVE